MTQSFSPASISFIFNYHKRYKADAKNKL